MIFLAFIVFTLLLAAMAFAVLFKRSQKSGFKNAFLNSLTLAHVGLYLLFTIYLLIRVDLPIFGFNKYLFIDPLAIFEVLITEAVFLLAALYGRGYVNSLLLRGDVKAESLELFYGCFNLLLVAITYCFFSNNLALFWILLELTTILSAVLIVMLSARENVIAALKYVFIASTAMLFTVIGLIILFAITKQVQGSGTLKWDELLKLAPSLPPSLFIFAFVFAFIGFASKAGIAPFHTWLPQAYSKAPSVVSVVMSAVVSNAGIYGILRLFAIAHGSQSWHNISIILVIFGAISIAVAALSLLPRTNIKKLVGFSSVEHMGLVLIGIGIGTPIALFWTLFHILANSLIKSLLFFCAGILHYQYDSNYLPNIFNALKIQPLATWGFIIGSVAVIGMPPFPMFFSKLMLLTQIAAFSLPLLAIVLTLLLIIAGAFAVLLIRSLARQSEQKVKTYEVHWTMKMAIIILLVVIVGISFSLAGGMGNALRNITASLGFQG